MCAYKGVHEHLASAGRPAPELVGLQLLVDGRVPQGALLQALIGFQLTNSVYQPASLFLLSTQMQQGLCSTQHGQAFLQGLQPVCLSEDVTSSAQQLETPLHTASVGTLPCCAKSFSTEFHMAFKTKGLMDLRMTSDRVHGVLEGPFLGSSTANLEMMLLCNVSTHQTCQTGSSKLHPVAVQPGPPKHACSVLRAVICPP